MNSHVCLRKRVLMRPLQLFQSMSVPVLPRLGRNMHTGVTCLLASREHLTESVELLLRLGFEESFALSDSRYRVHRLHGKTLGLPLHIDLFEDALHSRIWGLRSLVSRKPRLAAVTLQVAISRRSPSDVVWTGAETERLSRWLGIHEAYNAFRQAAGGASSPLVVHVPDDGVAQGQGERVEGRDGRVDDPAAGAGPLGALRIREVVLPCVEEVEGQAEGGHVAGVRRVLAAAGLLPTNLYDVFCSQEGRDNGIGQGQGQGQGQGISVRLFPCTTVGVVVQVASTDAAAELLRALPLPSGRPVSFGRLGNAAADMELQLQGPALCQALDLRVSNSSVVRPFYREGSAALLAGSLASTQNARVAAGDNPGDTDVDSRTLHGDCWGEVKAMTRNHFTGAGAAAAVTVVQTKAGSGYVMKE